MFRRLVLPLLMSCVHGCGWVVGELPEPFDDRSPDASTEDVAEDVSVDSPDDASIDLHLDVMPDERDTHSSPEADACDPCDCDGDGAEAEVCDGDDCDDLDPHVHPGQDKYFETPSDTVGFDYDCSGSIERDPALNVSLKCVGLSLILCEQSTQGFIGGVPACGSLGDWGTCKPDGLGCVSDIYEQRRMRCK